jgi:hypothetical protein
LSIAPELELLIRNTKGMDSEWQATGWARGWHAGRSRNQPAQAGAEAGTLIRKIIASWSSGNQSALSRSRSVPGTVEGIERFLDFKWRLFSSIVASAFGVGQSVCMSESHRAALAPGRQAVSAKIDLDPRANLG